MQEMEAAVAAANAATVVANAAAAAAITQGVVMYTGAVVAMPSSLLALLILTPSGRREHGFRHNSGKMREGGKPGKEV